MDLERSMQSEIGPLAGFTYTWNIEKTNSRSKTNLKTKPCELTADLRPPGEERFGGVASTVNSGGKMDAFMIRLRRESFAVKNLTRM